MASLEPPSLTSSSHAFATIGTKWVSAGMVRSGCASSISRSSVVPDRETPTTKGAGGRPVSRPRRRSVRLRVSRAMRRRIQAGRPLSAGRIAGRGSDVDHYPFPALKKPMNQPWDAPLQVPDCPEGWTTGPPDYVGIGAQRCGTSWWYDSMRRNPGIQRSPLGKEVHYFDRYWRGDAPDDIAAEYASLFPRQPGNIVGEWTPRYLADHWAIPLLRRAAPNARLLVMLRDPVARYRSAIARLERKAEERGCRVLLPQVNDANWRGFYFEQMRHLLDLFPRDQVLVLQFERCVADPAGEMERTCRFLGVEPPREFPERLTQHKQADRKTRALPPHVSDELAGRYREDSSRLGELCPEIDLSLWPSVDGPPRRAPSAATAVVDG